MHFLSALILSFILSFFSRYYLIPFQSQVTAVCLITFSVALTVWFFSLDAYSSYLLLHNKVPPNQAAFKKKSTSYCSQIRGSGGLLLTQSLREVEPSFGQGYSHLKINCYKFCFHTHYSVRRPPVPTMQTSPQSYVNMAD